MKLLRVPSVGFKHGIKNILSALINYYSESEMDDIQSDTDMQHMFFSSGKSALCFALLHLAKIYPTKNKVIIPSYTCYSVPAVVLHSKLKLVICDIIPSTFDFDYAQLEQLIRDDVLCVIGTKLFGVAINADRIRDLCNKYGSIYIEDLAHEMPDLVNKKKDCSDMRIYSTGRGKPLSTNGGGILVVNNTKYLETMHLDYRALPRLSNTYGRMKVFECLITDVILNPYLFWVANLMPFLEIGKTVYPKKINLLKQSLPQIKLLKFLMQESNAIHCYRKNIVLNYRSMLAQFPNAETDITIPNEYAPARFPFFSRKPLQQYAPSIINAAKKYGIVRMYPDITANICEVKTKIQGNGKNYSGGLWIKDHLLTLPTHTWVSEKLCNDIIKLAKNFR